MGNCKNSFVCGWVQIPPPNPPFREKATVCVCARAFHFLLLLGIFANAKVGERQGFNYHIRLKTEPALGVGFFAVQRRSQ